jgi:TolB-like protein
MRREGVRLDRTANLVYTITARCCMRKIAFACLLFSAVIPVFSATLAISTFTISGQGVTADHQALLIDLYTAALANQKGVQLVERRNLEKSLKEIEFSLSDLVDSNTALRAGQIMGAAYLLTGSLIGLGDGAFVSAQVIDNTSGAVVVALAKEIKTVSVDALRTFVGESTAKIIRRLGAPNSTDIDLLWLTKSATVNDKPVLIYIMSNVADSQDPNGQWYLGPQHLKAVTDVLRAKGYGVEISDRRSLDRLSSANLSAYSQVWLLEGDGNNIVDPTPKDVMALYNFYMNGGGIWLSGENVLNQTDANWVEDVNAFAEVFGVQIGHVVISREPWLTVADSGSHPLTSGVRRLVFDNEVGRLVISNKNVTPVVFLDPGSRILGSDREVNALFKLAEPERLKQVQNGKKDWSIVWLLGKNAVLIGPEIGAGAAAVAVADERGTNKGRLIIDSGWLLGWAFNGDRGEIATIGDDLQFVQNAATWLSQPADEAPAAAQPAHAAALFMPLRRHKGLFLNASFFMNNPLASLPAVENAKKSDEPARKILSSRCGDRAIYRGYFPTALNLPMMPAPWGERASARLRSVPALWDA